MPMNPIQFQKGLSLPAFLVRYGTEAQCEEALEKMRWPGGFSCPRCGHTACTRVRQGKQRLYQCTVCRHQASARVGTIYQSSKLPLTVWFLAVYLMTQSKNSVAALELKRTLGVCYKTAWMLKHKLLTVMEQREAGRVLTERVEVDDAYLGGVRAGKRGRGAAGKQAMVIAVQTRVDEATGEANPGYVRLDALPDFRRETLARWAEQALAPESLMVSDGLDSFRAAGAQVNHHQRAVVGTCRSSQLSCFHWVNTLLGNLKGALHGTYHGIQVGKYAQRYLAEMQYRFNRRFDLPAMVPRLLHACAHTSPCIGKRMRLAEVCR